MNFIQHLKNNKFLIISCLIVFIFALGIRIFYATQKAGFHLDEVTSIYIANCAYDDNKNLFLPNLNLFGYEVKKHFFAQDTSVADAIKDLKSLHIKNNDPPHTNLYYSLLRLAYIESSLELKELIYRGIALNVICFILSFFIMFKILNYFFKEDKIFVPFGLLVAFLNTGAISNTLFLRPYQLQETVFLLLVWVCINFFNDIKNGTLISKKNFFIASFVLALTLLTGYLAPLLIVLLGAGLLYASLKNKATKNISFLFKAVGFSFLFAMLFYSNYLNGFMSDRAQEAAGNIQLFNNLILAIKGTGENLFYFLYYFPCLILILFVHIRRLFLKKKIIANRMLVFFITVAFLWVLMVMFVAPYKIIRYIMPIFPLLSMFYVYSLYGYFGKIEKYCYIALFSIIIAIFAIFPTKTESVDTATYVAKKSFAYSAKLENLFLHATEFTEELDNNKELVVFLDIQDYIAPVIPHFSDEQIYWVRFDFQDLPKDDSFYILADKSYEMVDTTEYEIEKKINTGYFVYLTKVKRKK